MTYIHHNAGYKNQCSPMNILFAFPNGNVLLCKYHTFLVPLFRKGLFGGRTVRKDNNIYTFSLLGTFLFFARFFLPVKITRRLRIVWTILGIILTVECRNIRTKTRLTATNIILSETGQKLGLRGEIQSTDRLRNGMVMCRRKIT